MTQLVFAMTGAQGVPGGVSEVNLAILRTLIDLRQERPFDLRVMSFAEEEADRPPFLPAEVSFRAYHNDKLRFAADLLRTLPAHPVYLFDYVRLASPLIPFAAARLIKTLIFAHGIEYWKEMRRSDRWSIRYASRILTNSHYTLRRMRQALGAFRGVACPLGLSVRIPMNSAPPPRPEAALTLTACDGQVRPLGGKVLLLVARINRNERYKGHYPLLKVMPELLRRHPDAQLVFPGPGDDLDGVARFAREQGVDASVFLPGYLPKPELEDLYRRCHAFVMPSTCEGFGLVHLEAMNCARPCVGCFDDGAEDVIVHGETGYLVHDPNDAEELAGVVMRLLDDPEHADALGRAGFERLHAHFTPEQFRARLRTELLDYL